ncbi:MAG: WbqC family protein [Pseudodesulfovibrio sp.]
MRSVIMQPTYMPWAGFFDLMDQCDSFFFLDDVEFSKQSWQQRNRIRGQHGLEWITVPVLTKGCSRQLISETRLNGTAFVGKHVKQLRQNYGRARFFDRYIDSLAAVMRQAAETGLLCELNMSVILWIKEQLGVECTIARASRFEINARRSGRLVSLLREVGCTDYLSPVGSWEYLLEDYVLFEEAGIHIYLQRYQPVPHVQQFNPFVPYASVLDLLFNEGPGSLELIRRGNLGVTTLHDFARTMMEKKQCE